MLLRKAAQLIVILCLLAAVGFGVWVWKSKQRLYSSPSGVRDDAWYWLAFKVPVDPPPAPTNLYANFHIDRSDTGRVVISFPQSINFDATNYTPFQTIRADSNFTAKVGDGDVRLALVGSTYARTMTNLNEEPRLPLTYYTPAGKKLSEDAHEVHFLPKYERNAQVGGDFPAAQFVFVTTNMAEVKTLGFNLFDGRTHSQIADGYSSSSMNGGFFFNSTVQLWHQTPVEAVTKIAIGPLQNYDFPAEEGSELRFAGGTVRLMLKNENDLGGWNSRFDGRSNVINFSVREPFPGSPPRQSCSFLFHVWPRANSAPIEFEFLDAAGKTIRGQRSSTHGNLLVAVANGELSSVKQIRLKYYPNTYQIIYTIPELPGLPEENRNVQNLFDVQIPFIAFRYEYAFQDDIAKLLQMTGGGFSLTFPNSYFPTTRTNTSPRALFLEMDSLLSNPELQLVADPETNWIQTRPHPIRAAIEAIKKKLGL